MTPPRVRRTKTKPDALKKAPITTAAKARAKELDTTTVTLPDNPEGLLILILDNRGQVKALNDVTGQAQEELLRFMLERKVTSVKAEDSQGKLHKGTLVQPERTSIDEAQLRKLVGSTLWNKMTSRVFDRSKMDALLASGELDMQTVAKVTSIVKTSPHIRVT